MGSLPRRTPVPVMENILFWILRTLPCLEFLKVREFTLKAIRGVSLAWCLVLLPVFSSVCWPLPRTLSAQHANTEFNRSDRIKYKINCQTRSSFGRKEKCSFQVCSQTAATTFIKVLKSRLFSFFPPPFFFFEMLRCKCTSSLWGGYSFNPSSN